MKLLNFLPQDKKFNAHLIEMARLAAEASRHLQAGLKAAPEELGAIAAAVLSDKNAAKKALEDFTVDLTNSFVTPFDREDMQAVGLMLYRIPKRANKLMNRLHIPVLKAQGSDFMPLVDMLLAQAEALQQMMVAFNAHQMGKVHSCSATIHELEDKGEGWLAEKYTALLASEIDPRTFLLMKDVFDGLERMIDAYRDASDMALRVMLKHS